MAAQPGGVEMICKARPRVVILAPGCDGQDVGESWSCYQWVSGLADHCRLTLLTLSRVNATELKLALPQVEIVQWSDWTFARRFERFSSMAKPGYVGFYRQARRWLVDAIRRGREFDLIHQLGPLAMRYPSPGVGLGLPLIIGPVAGSLETPLGFRRECGRAPWYTKMRGIDRLRFSYDPLLRRSYASADVVIGVAPYVKEILSPIPLKRFELQSETGIHDLAPVIHRRHRIPQQLKLLFAGRAIRTKGLRDLVRAMGQLTDLPGVTLEVAGAGEDLDTCRREAKRLGLEKQIRFHGRITRSELELLYARTDVFAFPSFREPSGNVVFEAMCHGLPVITCNRGGPGQVVDDSSGFRLDARDPQQLATDLAATIRRLALNPQLIDALAKGAQRRIDSIARWERKIQQMVALYDSVLDRPTHE